MGLEKKAWFDIPGKQLVGLPDIVRSKSNRNASQWNHLAIIGDQEAETDRCFNVIFVSHLLFYDRT
jgi:hypothetical protein